MPPDPAEMCLSYVRHGANAIYSGSFVKAGQMLRSAEQLAHSMLPGPASDFVPLVHCHVSLLRYRLGQIREGKKLHESVMTLLDRNSTRMEAVDFQDAMAKVLMKLHEYGRAIPFCERAIQQAAKGNHPTAVATKLARAGKCYSAMGLQDHAAVPSRAALKILREYPADPSLPGGLITLGNALRKNSPSEAENLYLEAAGFFEIKAQLVSATPVWNNLGSLCLEHARYAEALDYFEKALRVREQDPSTTPAAMGRLLINMSLYYGRTGDFEEAHWLLDRGIRLLKVDQQECAPTLATAYGTRGLIFRYEGHDAKAVEWFQRSFAQGNSTPSPNFETTVEFLEEEIAALKRLGRSGEAILAENWLESVNAARNEISHIERDLSSLTPEAKGAVLVEIGYGRPRSQGVEDDLAKLGVDLKDAVEGQNAGFSGGRLAIPESTTFTFYGEDAEVLFRAIEPILIRERVFEGASVTIQQRKEVRALNLPGPVI